MDSVAEDRTMGGVGGSSKLNGMNPSVRCGVAIDRGLRTVVVVVVDGIGFNEISREGEARGAGAATWTLNFVAATFSARISARSRLSAHASAKSNNTLNGVAVPRCSKLAVIVSLADSNSSNQTKCSAAINVLLLVRNVTRPSSPNLCDNSNSYCAKAEENWLADFMFLVNLVF